jgi:hypothetical protein
MSQGRIDRIIFWFLGGKLSHCPVISVTKMSGLYEHLFTFTVLKILITKLFNLKLGSQKCLESTSKVED